MVKTLRSEEPKKLPYLESDPEDSVSAKGDGPVPAARQEEASWGRGTAELSRQKDGLGGVLMGSR